MQFNNELHEQLFALFIAYSNSAHFNKMGGPNTEQWIKKAKGVRANE